MRFNSHLGYRLAVHEYTCFFQARRRFPDFSDRLVCGISRRIVRATGFPAANALGTQRPAKNEQTRGITWLTHEPLDFLFRRGDHFDDESARYQRMCEPENLRHMAAAGVRFGRIYFYKGFGPEYERANMEQDKRTAEIMHQLGMKVGLYMGGTMFTETLYRERPEARNWEQRDQNDHWVPYGMQTFRHYACPNEPAYRDYLKKILKFAVQEVHADQISFDNIMLQPEPQSCRWPRCR